MHTGPDTLPWTDEIWGEIHRAVHDEMQRVAIAAKFLPPYGPMPEALTTTSDAISTDDQDRLTIDEAAVAPLCELWAEFAMTPQQVAEERQLRSARTLAIRAANFVARAQDAAIFQGDEAMATNPLFTRGDVRFRSGPAGTGLLGGVTPDRAIAIEPSSAKPPKSKDRDSRAAARRAAVGDSTFAAVAESYQRLQDRGHYGPYALVLRSEPFGAAFAPLPGTLILPADRILPLVTRGLYGTGSLPPATGLFLSLGGDTMDLAVGLDATTSFEFEDDDGKYRFRVLSRFALRLKDPTAVIRFDFATAGQEA